MMPPTRRPAARLFNDRECALCLSKPKSNKAADDSPGPRPSRPSTHGSGECFSRTSCRIRDSCRQGDRESYELMRLAGDDERLPAMAQEALRYIVAQIHDIEIRLKSFEQKDPVAREGKRGLQAADDGTIDWSLYRHRDRGDRRRSSQFRLWTSFRRLAGTDPKTAFYGRKRKAWRNRKR